MVAEVHVREINDAHGRERAFPVPFLQFSEAVRPGLRPVPRFQRRRRRAEHEFRPRVPAELLRGLPRVVPRRLFVLVRPLVFLVEDDEAEIAAGREEGAPGADDETDGAPVNPLPFLPPCLVEIDPER